MSISVLYISYTGLLEPLGQSQILQYLMGLAKDHKITLLTFEKPEALSDTKRTNALRKICEDANIDWHYLIWHSKPNIPATLYDLFAGKRKALLLARQKGVQIVHCRSYIGSMVGLYVKNKTGAKFIFDMRGFWPDERVDGGVWAGDSLPYKYFKGVERKLFLRADHVVSLTHSGAVEFSKFDYLQGRCPPVSVIPTCTNLDYFQPSPLAKSGFTLGYVGSIGTWYLFDDVAKSVARLFELRPDASFLVINKGGHDRITQSLFAHGVDMNRVEIMSCPYNEVGQHMGRMNAGIFFIKAAWSKRASCPTRMGEFLASGKPCLSNTGVGDVAKDLRETRTGLTLPVDEAGNVILSDLDQSLNRLIELSKEADIAQRCRQAAQTRFSLAGGTESYDAIYKSLGQKEN